MLTTPVSNTISMDKHQVDQTRVGPDLRSWSFFGLYDGHGGAGTSSGLFMQMAGFLIVVLTNLYKEYNDQDGFETLSPDGSGSTSSWMREPPARAIEDAIAWAFDIWDYYYVHRIRDEIFEGECKTPRAKAFWNISQAQCGSTGLLACYDHHTRQLRVACVGSSRAVLGRPVTDNKSGRTTYEVHVLSEDHTPSNASEVARLTSEHPGETLFANGLYLGLRTTRAFGDIHLKTPLADLKRLQDEYNGPPVPAAVKTPPYLNAEPTMSVIDVQAGDFLVLATDGLWEWLTSAEVVGLVGLWLNQQKPMYEDPLPRDMLPVVRMDRDTTERYKWWGAQKRFVNLDENAAAHVARNALGAADVDVAASLLAMRAPQARAYR
jgi:pyruvate dehydrogenase phosphatase